MCEHDAYCSSRLNMYMYLQNSVFLKMNKTSQMHKNVLGYCRNLGSLRYGTSTASCKDAYGKKPFFS